MVIVAIAVLEHYREISVGEALVLIMHLMLRNLLLTLQKFYETSGLVLFNVNTSVEMCKTVLIFSIDPFSYIAL